MLIRVGEAMRACGLVDAGDESRASGCARRRRAMGAPFGSAICAKRKRSFPARDCFENPGASLMSESSSLGSCRSSTRLPFWQQIDGFVTVKRSAPQFMHTSRCSKKLIGCAASRLLKRRSAGTAGGTAHPQPPTGVVGREPHRRWWERLPTSARYTHASSSGPRRSRGTGAAPSPL